MVPPSSSAAHHRSKTPQRETTKRTVAIQPPESECRFLAQCRRNAQSSDQRGGSRANGERIRAREGAGRDTEEEEENHLQGSYFTATLIVSFPTNIWKRFPVFVLSPDAVVAE